MMSGNVLPFRRPNRTQPAGQPKDEPIGREARLAPSDARALVVQQAATHRARYDQARSRQEEERLLATGIPVPARITLALDAGGHEGPEVDAACGAAQPAVDLWECGVEVPTAQQVRLLSELTGFPIRFFYDPIPPGPLDGPAWMCGRRGCSLVEPNYVDERGVLHYGGELPRTPPRNVQTALF